MLLLMNRQISRRRYRLPNDYRTDGSTWRETMPPLERPVLWEAWQVRRRLSTRLTVACRSPRRSPPRTKRWVGQRATCHDYAADTHTTDRLSQTSTGRPLSALRSLSLFITSMNTPAGVNRLSAAWRRLPRWR